MDGLQLSSQITIFSENYDVIILISTMRILHCNVVFNVLANIKLQVRAKLSKQPCEIYLAYIYLKISHGCKRRLNLITLINNSIFWRYHGDVVAWTARFRHAHEHMISINIKCTCPPIITLTFH